MFNYWNFVLYFCTICVPIFALLPICAHWKICRRSSQLISIIVCHYCKLNYFFIAWAFNILNRFILLLSVSIVQQPFAVWRRENHYLSIFGCIFVFGIYRCWLKIFFAGRKLLLCQFNTVIIKLQKFQFELCNYYQRLCPLYKVFFVVALNMHGSDTNTKCHLLHVRFMLPLNWVDSCFMVAIIIAFHIMILSHIFISLNHQYCK